MAQLTRKTWTRELDGVAFVFHCHAPNRSYGVHDHAESGMLILLDGDRSESIGNLEYIQPSGSVAYFGDRLPHGWSSGPRGVVALTVRFAPRVLAEMGHDLKVESMVRPPLNIGQGAAFRLLRSGLQDDAETLWAEALELLTPIAGAPEKKRPMWLERAKEYLDGDRGAQVGLRKVATEVGIDPVHLAKTFRAHYGESVMGYLRSRRVALALRSILVEEEPLGEVSARLGFSDQAHLTRLCRQYAGLPPGELRSRLLR